MLCKCQYSLLVGPRGTSPGESGTILSYPADEKTYDYFDQQAPIIKRRFDDEEVTLTLPRKILAHQVGWVSVWCRNFSLDFGSVLINTDTDFTPLKKNGTNPSFNEPTSVGPGLVGVPNNTTLLDGAGVSVGALSEKAHGVKGSVTFTSPINLVISGFSYDGLAPDAFFMVIRPY